MTLVDHPTQRHSEHDTESSIALAESETASHLADRILNRQSTVGVVGMGYVGLPLALAMVDVGFPVIGFDVDEAKIRDLTAGESYISHIEGARISDARKSERLSATSDFERLAEADVVLICVPTPLTSHREPDLTYVRITCEAIAWVLRPGQLVVLESTTYPGTTHEVVVPRLETSQLTCGEDFFVAFSPERENPGDTQHSTTTVPKVVGGVDPVSTELAELFYRAFVPEVVTVSSARAAEATKLTENIFRAVNIALVNELKVLFDQMDIDVREVLDAAATKPFGFMRFDPGPGWGGHCIPVDPFYLSWKAREFGGNARFIELAGIVNVEMPKYVVGKLQQGLNDARKAHAR